MADKKQRVLTFCPICGRLGSPKLGGFCKNHVQLEQDSIKPGKHILQSFVDDIAVRREFIPRADKPGIIKDRFGIER